MKIALVGARNTPEELACTHWSGLDRTLKESEHEHKLFCCRSGEQFIDDLIEYRPDVVIYGLIDMAVEQGWRDRIRSGLPHAKIVLWYTDCRTSDTGQIDPVDLRGTVDLFVVSNDGLKEFQRHHFGMTPEFVPQAVYPLDKPEYSIKVTQKFGYFVFIGGKIFRKGYENRAKMIVELERKHGLKVINGRSKEARAKIYNLMPKIYGSAKFSLDSGHFWDVEKYTSNRFWVIPGFWGFALTKRFKGCEELYPPNVRVYWDTIEELAEKIDYYHENEHQRKEMIRKGWEWTVKHHTYKHRIDKILSML